MKHCKKKDGFTLIELLVVVLIIGILSAIALPQYTKAVEKSRAAEAVQILRYMNEQVKLCVLANGEDGCYRKPNADLGIELGGMSCEWTGDEEICCNKNWCYVNNGTTWGDFCAGGIGNVIAARVDGVPEDLSNMDRRYLLEYETCEGSANQIVCYESSDCNIFRGEGKPIF